MQEQSAFHQIETAELNKEKMQFTVVNHKPAKVDDKTRDAIEQELYTIFKKYF
jgi:hypothetical protein